MKVAFKTHYVTLMYQILLLYILFDQWMLLQLLKVEFQSRNSVHLTAVAVNGSWKLSWSEKSTRLAVPAVVMFIFCTLLEVIAVALIMQQ